jgi:hypothetical protein
VVLGRSIVVGSVEESLGRNATNVEASTTKSTAHLNASNLHAELTSLNGSNITTRAATNDDEIIFLTSSSGESTLEDSEH